MFAESVFIKKNISELGEKLKNLGYKELNKDDNPLNWVITLPEESSFMSFNPHKTNPKHLLDCINCGKNEKLFLALAALRDKMDYMQWFINDLTGQWVFCHEPCITWMLGGEAEEYHTKATKEELINHFK